MAVTAAEVTVVAAAAVVIRVVVAGSYDRSQSYIIDQVINGLATLLSKPFLTICDFTCTEVKTQT